MATFSEEESGGAVSRGWMNLLRVSAAGAEREASEAVGSAGCVLVLMARTLPGESGRERRPSVVAGAGEVIANCAFAVSEAVARARIAASRKILARGRIRICDGVVRTILSKGDTSNLCDGRIDGRNRN
jgi:hypothetical protein